MLILLPPSEGKVSGGHDHGPSLSRTVDLPHEIATSASEKELKCTGARYAQGMELNHSIDEGPWMSAIDRYDGVMYRAINYQSMSQDGKAFFNTHVRIISGLYGLVRPQNQIANYKLPVSTRLKHFWKEKLTQYINTIEPSLIIDLLPGAHCAMIDRGQIDAHVVSVKRHNPDGTNISHGVKGIKGQRLHQICNNQGKGMDWGKKNIIFVS